MYLSRMKLNPQRRQAKALLGSPQMMHAAVMAAFPPGANQSDERVLWRVDQHRETVSLFVVSPIVPSFEHLQEQAGWSQQKTWETRDYTPLLDRLTKGQRYAFRLTANPVHTVSTGSGKKRLAHVTVAHQLRWLEERQDRMGVRLMPESYDVVHREIRKFRRQARTVTLSQVTFEGCLEVTDAHHLNSVLRSGIGKGRAYGCGLLTLAPRA